MCTGIKDVSPIQSFDIAPFTWKKKKNFAFDSDIRIEKQNEKLQQKEENSHVKILFQNALVRYMSTPIQWM